MIVSDQRGNPDVTDAFHNFLKDIVKNQVIDSIESTNPRGWHRDLALHGGPFGPRDRVSLDLAPTGYTFPSRWNKLIREYIPTEYWHLRPTKDLAPANQNMIYFAHGGRHTKGPCMATFTFARRGTNLDVTVHSRTTYILPMGVLDWTIMNLMAQNYMWRYRFFKTYTITWMLSQAQWRIWTGLPYLESTGMIDVLREVNPDHWVVKKYDWAKAVWWDERIADSSYILFQNWRGDRYLGAYENPRFIPHHLGLLDRTSWLAYQTFDPNKIKHTWRNGSL